MAERKKAKEPRKIVSEPCSVELSMRILGGKWTGSILYHLKDEPVRFNDLSRGLVGASKKILTERLRHLESHQLIERRILPTSPIGVEYAITPIGQAAIEGLEVLKTWSENLPEPIKTMCRDNLIGHQN